MSGMRGRGLWRRNERCYRWYSDHQVKDNMLGEGRALCFHGNVTLSG